MFKLQNISSEAVWRGPFRHAQPRLAKDWPVVQFGRDKVHGTTMFRVPRRQRPGMGVKAAVFGQE